MANRKRRPTGSRTRTPGAAGRPRVSSRKPMANRPRTEPAIVDTSLRMRVAKRSRGFILALSRLPTFVVPAIVVALMLVGLLATVEVAVPALVVIIGFMTWLAYLSWPVLAAPQRSMRVLAIGILTCAAVARVAGWF